jgi:preprotein translocase subunit YajC
MTALFLQAAGPASYMNLLFFALIFVVFYFFLIRPQAKKQKEQTKFVDSMQKGDEVVTGSGIIGRINKIEDDIVTLEVGTKVFIRVVKSAISKEMTEMVNKAAANRPASNNTTTTSES